MGAADNQQVPELGNAGSHAVPRPNKFSSGKLTRLQMVDDEQRFSDKLSEYMQQRWGLADAGFDYNVVAVFGSQSTGK
ncbi:Dynamin-like GTPase that mediates homotypic ER fusion, partial [Coemansia sp. RSA 560]